MNLIKSVFCTPYKAILLVTIMINLLTYTMEPSKEMALFIHQAGIGSLVGATEVLINQPLIYGKNTIQQKKKPSMNPRVFYRGLGIGVACMAPTTAMQLASENALKKILPSTDIKIATIRALLAGAFSALASTPTELIVLHQQNSGHSAYKTATDLVSKSGFSILYRGALAKSSRDAIFCAGLLSIYPYLQEFLHKKSGNASLAALGAGICAGAITTAISHPFDTISTLIQADSNRQQNSMQTIVTLYKNNGYSGFFKGMVPRGTRVMLAIPLMNYVKTVYANLLIPSEK